MKTYGIQLKNYEERQVAVAVIVTKEGRYVLRRDNDDGYIQHIRGGIDEGESPQDAAIREVQEETGFTEFDSVEQIYFNYEVFESFGDVNRKSICYPFLVQLASDKQIGRNLEEGEFEDYELIELSYEDLIATQVELNIADHTVDLISLVERT